MKQPTMAELEKRLAKLEHTVIDNVREIRDLQQEIATMKARWTITPPSGGASQGEGGSVA